MRRAVIIVLDSVGIGELPDAAEYGDAGSNTLLNIKKEIPGMELRNLTALGLSAIDGASALAEGCAANGSPGSAYCKLAEASNGKDTTIGHWEIAGVVTEVPFPTFPQGFPNELILDFERKIGRKTLGNTVASGTDIINKLGDEHVRTGSPIIYTSADSVFQIAMHEGIIPIDEQYRISMIARELLTGEYNVSRVITRPFIGIGGGYKRTANRRDFSVEPPAPTILDHIKAAGLNVAGVGKISDIFAGRGVTGSVHTENNTEGVDATLEMLKKVPDGLIFTNLVDFDMVYGHRNDAQGYAGALMEFDKRVPELISALQDGDMLFITADHGCDPTTASTDHSREYVPLLVYGKMVKPGTNLGIRRSFADIGATVLEFLEVSGEIKGESFLRLIT